MYIVAVRSLEDPVVSSDNETWARFPGVKVVYAESIPNSWVDIEQIVDSKAQIQTQEDAIKSIVRSYRPDAKWHFIAGASTMVFPPSIETYLANYDPDAPLMIGRVISTASQSIPNAVGSILHSATQAAQVIECKSPT